MRLVGRYFVNLGNMKSFPLALVHGSCSLDEAQYALYGVEKYGSIWWKASKVKLSVESAAQSNGNSTDLLVMFEARFGLA